MCYYQAERTNERLTFKKVHTHNWEAKGGTKSRDGRRNKLRPPLKSFDSVTDRLNNNIHKQFFFFCSKIQLLDKSEFKNEMRINADLCWVQARGIDPYSAAAAAAAAAVVVDDRELMMIGKQQQEQEVVAVEEKRKDWQLSSVHAETVAVEWQAVESTKLATSHPECGEGGDGDDELASSLRRMTAPHQPPPCSHQLQQFHCALFKYWSVSLFVTNSK